MSSIRPAILGILLLSSAGCFPRLSVDQVGRTGGFDTGDPAGDDDGGAADGGAADGGASSDGGADTGPVDADGDGFADASAGGTDCDDGDPDVHPGATEVCDGVDDDCDGEVDEDAADAPTWYTDADGDGYGDDATAVTACDPPSAGAVQQGGDCDDGDPAFHPGAEESCTDPADYNCDGSTGYADADADGWAACEECDDANPDVHPGAGETCNEVDDDCDGDVDEDAEDASPWYADADGDGYGDGYDYVYACDAPSGRVGNFRDCDDTDPNVYAGAPETCNGTDDDCDGDVDEGAVDAATWYADADGDGYGDPAATETACDAPSGYVGNARDCDDGDAGVYPGAPETCNEVDDDCDGDVDEGAVDAATWYADADGDGYGDPATTETACDAPSGYVGNAWDCDDGDAGVNPAATEVCNEVDDDCDGDVDWGLGVPTSHATIQDAIDAASDGDTICVSAGTYAETIDFSGKDLVVEGWEGAASTTIDGAGTGPVVTFDGGEPPSATLRGFTITGGSAREGAGIYVEGSDPTLEDLVVEGNACASATSICMGAGIYVDGSYLALDGVEIRSNEASPGRSVSTGQALGIGLYATGSDLVLQDVDVIDNAHVGVANYMVTLGAGVAVLYSDVLWSGGTVAGNVISDGGAPTSSGYGGGIYLYDSVMDAEHLVVADHDVDINEYGGGGGFFVSYADLWLANSIVAGNRVAGASGGGMSGIPGNAGGGLLVAFNAYVGLENCDLVGNEADPSDDGEGGAIYLGGSSDVELLDTNVVGNDADEGGAVAMGTIMGTLGGLDASYSNFHDNGSDPFDPIGSPVGTDGNISGDPLYADTSSADAVDWDLTLDPSSPCVDAGDPTLSDPDGSIADIGAYGGPGGGW